MPFEEGHKFYEGAGRPSADHTGTKFGTLVVERVATSLEIRNWLQREMNPYEKHKYWRTACLNCHRVVILRSDVVIAGVKKCLCAGGRRAFRGITCEVDSK